MKNPPFQSGAIRLPPREFLKRLPVRVSHLVFEIASEEKNNMYWKELRMKLLTLSGLCEMYDKKNEPIYFFKMEHGLEFQWVNTNYYFEAFNLPDDTVWVVRFEEHTHFATFSFHRYFKHPCTSFKDGGALDFLNTLNFDEDYIAKLLKHTVPGGNMDLAVVPQSFNSDELAKAWNLTAENHYVTKSLVFDGMAEVLMSFQIDEDQTATLRPVIIREIKDMSERAAGEVIQILLQIEAYRAMATRQIFREDLRVMLDSLENSELYFVQVNEVCQKNIFKEPNLFKDLFIVEDYLPILNELTKIALKIDNETAKHARQYDTAQAYSNLALDRLDDLREKPIDQEPTIKTFLRHRLKQIDQTYRAIGQRQNCLSGQISQLDGLLQSRMGARQNFSVHCVHFMVLILTIFITFKYLKEIIEIELVIQHCCSINLLWAFIILSGIAIVSYFTKKINRNCIKRELKKAEHKGIRLNSADGSNEQKSKWSSWKKHLRRARSNT